ncbi:DoxX family protein [Streptomyces sp. SCSIO 30461]|uniref:DoxX family protein n=1 Tax=Streptomyces sp. SCSIO 30461 TaxID=3118085 RepID=UPI0030CA6B17
MNTSTEGARHSPAHGAGPAPFAVGAADAGLLLLRLATGVILAGFGAQKLFGVLGGSGIDGTGKWFADLGYRPGSVYAGLAGTSEFLGGIGLAIGLLTPLAAAAAVGVMINAISVAEKLDLWAATGIAFPMIIAVAAVTVAAVGPGSLAVDRFFPWRDGGWGAFAFALLAGGIGAVLVLALKGSPV